MKALLLFSSFILTSLCSYAQLAAISWMRKGGRDVAADRNGMIYLVRDSLYPNKASGVNLIKYDPQGNVVSTVAYGDSLLWLKSQCIEVNNNKDVFISGVYRSNMSRQFGNASFPPAYNTQFFTAKIDSGGIMQWAKVSAAPFGVNSSPQYFSMACDNKGNVYVSSTFADSITFGTTKLKDKSSSFILKYDNTGNLSWAASTSASSLGNSTVKDITVDTAGNLFLTGSFNGTINLLGASLTAIPGLTSFIAKSTPAGINTFVQIVKGIPKSISVSNSGDIYVGGEFSDTVTFGTTILKANGSSKYGSYLIKYNSTGVQQWVKKTSDSCTVSPILGPHVVFDNSTQTAYLTGSNNHGCLIYKFDNAGNSWGYTLHVATSNPPPGYLSPANIKINPQGRVYIVGQFNNSIIVGTDTLKDFPLFLFKIGSDRTESVESVKNADGFRIYPNPASRFVNIETEKKTFNSIKIFDIAGQKVFETALKQPQYKWSLNVDALTPGNYIIQIDGGNNIQTAKLVIEH